MIFKKEKPKEWSLKACNTVEASLEIHNNNKRVLYHITRYHATRLQKHHKDQSSCFLTNSERSRHNTYWLKVTAGTMNNLAERKLRGN